MSSQFSTSTLDLDPLSTSTPPLSQASNRADGYCGHPSLVGTICTDMPRMKGCEPWNALCSKKGSLAPQCSQPGPLPNAPSTAEATKSVQAMCSSHSMPGCEACGQGAAAGAEGCREPLAALAMVCASMPGMRDCRQLAQACGVRGGSGGSKNIAEAFPKTCAFAVVSGGDKNTNKNKGHAAASLAGTDAPPLSSYDLPPMRMFVHTDAEDIVLARQWVPRSPGTVAAACLGTVGGGFLSQALRAARGAAEAAVAARLVRGGAGGGRGGGLFSSPAAGARLGRNALRAVATFASSLLDLLLMLIAMTFSWPLMLSVAAGYGLGALAFGALAEPRVDGGGGRGGGGGNGGSEEFGNGGGEEFGNGRGKLPESTTNGFPNREGVHLHGGTEGVDGASCCDLEGERDRERERERKLFFGFFFFRSSSPSSFFCLLTPTRFLSPFFVLLLLSKKKLSRKTGGIGDAKLSTRVSGSGNGAAEAKGRGGGWFGGKP